MKPRPIDEQVADELRRLVWLRNTLTETMQTQRVKRLPTRAIELRLETIEADIERLINSPHVKKEGET